VSEHAVYDKTLGSILLKLVSEHAAYDKALESSTLPMIKALGGILLRMRARPAKILET